MDITAQTAHGFQLSEFRDHCRIPWTTDDPAIQRSLDGGVSMWETSTNWYLRATTITLPITPEMTVPFGPAPTITSVAKNQYGALVSTVTDRVVHQSTLGRSSVWADSDGYMVSSAYEYIATMQVAGSVTPAVKSAVFDLGYHLWRDREGSVVGAMVSEIPLSLRTIISNHQLGGL